MPGRAAVALPLQISFCICSPLRPFVSPLPRFRQCSEGQCLKKELMRFSHYHKDHHARTHARTAHSNAHPSTAAILGHSGISKYRLCGLKTRHMAGQPENRNLCPTDTDQLFFSFSIPITAMRRSTPFAKEIPMRMRIF